MPIKAEIQSALKSSVTRSDCCSPIYLCKLYLETGYYFKSCSIVSIFLLLRSPPKSVARRSCILKWPYLTCEIFVLNAIRCNLYHSQLRARYYEHDLSEILFKCTVLPNLSGNISLSLLWNSIGHFIDIFLFFGSKYHVDIGMYRRSKLDGGFLPRTFLKHLVYNHPLFCSLFFQSNSTTQQEF